MSKRLVFIASGGRTGTRFFGEVLGKVLPDCFSEHEPDLFAGPSLLTLARIRRFGSWHMATGRLLGLTGVRSIGQRLLEDRIDIDTAVRRLRAMRRGYHAGISQSLIVESYSVWWMVAGYIDTIWPEARLAGIVRDPREWIMSWQRHQARRREGTLTEVLPPGPLTPARLGDTLSADIWPRLDQIGRMAWEWTLICNTLDHAAASNPNVRVFRFEDLFSQNSEEMHRFADFIARKACGPTCRYANLDNAANEVYNASRGDRRGWQDWSDAQVAAVAFFCREAMERHGYGGEPEWRERVERAGPL